MVSTNKKDPAGKQGSDKAIVTQPKIKSNLTFGFGREQVDLIKSMIAKNSTDDELKLFLYTAQRTGLDPLTKQIYCIKRKDQMTIQTGIDGYRTIAGRTGELAGIDDPVFDSEEYGVPKKATVTVYRFVTGERVPFTASARWNEYAPDTTQAQGFMWKKMPYLMLGKVAEALALRKAFPNDLTGVYTKEEMDQASDTPGKVVESAGPPKFVCSEHGDTIRKVAAGTTKQGKPYPAFWSCSTRVDNGFCKAPIITPEGQEARHNKVTGELEVDVPEAEVKDEDIDTIVPGSPPVNQTTPEKAAEIMGGEVLPPEPPAQVNMIGVNYWTLKSAIAAAHSMADLQVVERDINFVKKTLTEVEVGKLRSEFAVKQQQFQPKAA